MANAIIGKVIEGYRIERMLGQGGMAAVYEGKDQRTGRSVAMKIMHAHLASQRAFRELFAREAQSAARLDHPNIVNVEGFNFAGEYLYISMELITGGNLRKYVKRLAQEGQFIDYPEAAEVVRQLASGIHYAHDRGMVHRDLKPDNVMLKPITGRSSSGLNYVPIITDFGLAQLTTAGSEEATAQQPIGTYPYMSPEQVNAEPVDRRTDIYALGIILYELSVGRLPYNPKTIAEAARMHGREEIPLPSEFQRNFPEPLEKIIVKCMQKDARDRYQTADEIARDLEDFIALGNKPTAKLASVVDEPSTQDAAPVPPVDEDDYKTEPEPVEVEDELPPAPVIAPVEPDIEPEPEPEPDEVVEPEPVDEDLAYAPPETPDDLPPPPPVVDDSDDDDEYVTDVQTPVMDMPLPPEVPPSIRRLERTADQLTKDHLAVYSALESFLYELADDTESFDIGREATDEILLQGQYVSRNHGVVERKPNGVYTFIDPGSTNGIWVDDHRVPVNQEQILNEHKILRMGEYWVQFLPKQRVSRRAEAAGAGQQQTTAEVAHLQEDEQTELFGMPPYGSRPEIEPPTISADQMVEDRLMIYQRGDDVEVVLLTADTYSLGSDNDNDIVLPSRYVSPHHALLERGDDGYFYCRDLGGKNGTFFDQERIPPNELTRLSARRVMRMGDFWIEFEAGRRIGDALSSSRGGIGSTRGRSQIAFDDSIDTGEMLRPLDEQMPPISIPPVPDRVRASDRLVFFSEDHPIQVEPLEKNSMTVGRSAGQDIRLRGKRISREHAVFELRPDGNIYVTDQDSRNGVWMGDTLLVPGTAVQWPKEELIRMANYWVKFERAVEIGGLFGGQHDKRGLIGKTIGQYRIDRYVGESSLSSVYKATDLQLEQDVALRIMLPERAAEAALKQRFLEEARAMTRLDHPNVINVRSYNEVGGELFMVMELITGGNLRRVLQDLSDRNQRMDIAQATDITIQLANGLHYAHEQGLVHRDVKPDNIVLKTKNVIGPIKEYQPILTDFRVAGAAYTEDIFNTQESALGFAYISPEAARGEATDIRSDIYELGTAFYEMLVGRSPFQPRSLAEAVRMHTREAIVPPSEFRPDLNAEIEAVIMRSLSKMPNDRYQSAIDFARALERATAISGVDVPGVTSASFYSSLIDEQATKPLDEIIPAEMPLRTQPPLPDGEIHYDRLVFYSELHPTLVFDMTKNIYTVGRGEDQDIQLSSDNISRRHARIERSNDGTYRVQDVGSSNGSHLGHYKLLENVTEIWDEEETLRIGDYWVRIETIEAMEAARNYVVKVTGPPTEDDEYDTDSGWSPPANVPKPDHDKIGVTVTPTTMRVMPGSSVTLQIEVENRNDYVDHFIVEAIGLPPEWVTQPVGSIDLLPYNRETTSLTLHPPMSTLSSAGAHAFEIRVTAQAKKIAAVRTQCSLIIEPFHSFTTELYPPRVRNRGFVELSIKNTGNTYDTYNIEMRDREDVVRFETQGGAQYTVAPGHIEDIGIGVRPRRRPLFGQAQYNQFEVIVTPVNEVAGGPQSQSGELAVTSRFAIWMVVVGIISLVLCCAITGATIFFNRRAANMEATQVAMVALTQDSATATAALDADDDGDGLSNRREAELGTLPNKPDTDEDGLSDGLEVLSWSTDPLKRDTDDDNLTDGVEVNETGTNPLKPDTDEDGIMDGEDPLPAISATDTPTPFPILEAGGACPGSPSPSRMAVGQQGTVEVGGVANRLREEPNKEGNIVGYMQPEASFIVLEGPVCDETDFILWWKVDFNGLQAWTAEGEGDEYYLVPPDGGGDSGGDTTTGAAVSDSGNETALDPGAVSSELPRTGSVALDNSQMGVQLFTNVTTSEWDTVLTSTAPLGMGWIKVQANWRHLQPDEANQSTVQLEEFYSHVRDAKANGYNVLVSIAKAPEWSRSTSSNAGPPDDLNMLGNFIDQMLAAVGNDIDAIEVWNEPNISREWTGRIEFSGAGYMQMFDVAYNRIRAYSSDITVVSAGLAPAPTSESSIDDREFLRQMYGAGLANYSNVAIGIHPYGWGNAPDVVCCDDAVEDLGWDDSPKFFFLNTIVAYRNIQLRFNDGDADLWATEFGWTTWEDLGGNPPEPWMNYLTSQEAARYVLRGFEVGQSLDYLGPMFLWNFNFADPTTINNRVEIAGFSFTITNENRDVNPRPLYNAFLGLR